MESPASLPGLGDGPFAVAKEVSAPRDGPVDVVIVDRGGAVTLVECKRAANPEARRWVVGQLLGYAAWLWKLDYKNFKLRFEALGANLTAPFDGLPDWREEAFRRDLSENLANGRFRLIIAADEINEGLRRTVTFLNSQTLSEVVFLAVSIDPATGQVGEIFGRDSSEAWPYRPSWKGARKKILYGIEDENAVRAAGGLLRWAADHQPMVEIRFKPETSRGVVRTASGSTLFRIEQHREVRVSFHGLHGDEKRIDRLREDLVAVDPDFEGGDRPSVPLEALVLESKREAFLAVIERTFEGLTTA